MHDTHTLTIREVAAIEQMDVLAKSVGLPAYSELRGLILDLYSWNQLDHSSYDMVEIAEVKLRGLKLIKSLDGPSLSDIDDEFDERER